MGDFPLPVQRCLGLNASDDCLLMPWHFCLDSCWLALGYSNQLAFYILFFFCLYRRSLVSSNPRMKSLMGNLILNGPSGYRSCVVPAALAETALFLTRATSQKQGPAWWIRNWNSTLFPVQRSVTYLQHASCDQSPEKCLWYQIVRAIGPSSPVLGLFWGRWFFSV